MMRTKTNKQSNLSVAIILTGLMIVIWGNVLAHAAPAPLGTAITYQGQLKDGGALASGSFDMEFNLYDGSDPLLAALMGSDSEDSVAVSNGVFTVELDFGSVYDGEARWLEIGVKPAGDPGLYTYLAPLQPLTAVPQALFALEGNEGPAGPAGATGPTGEPGPSGPIGPEGVTGPSGPAGPTGAEGPSGPIGSTGLSGPAGETGADGPSGPAGVTGPSGPSGPAGLTGPSGPMGATGATGDVGATGPVGSTGPSGDPGAVGATGPQGPLGPTGPEGTTGAAGDPGTAGRSVLNGTGDPDDALGEDGDFYLDTSASAMWGPKASGSWATTGPVPLVGPTGPDGPTGASGPPGPSGPQGDMGTVGETGPTGETGAAGATGPVGPSGAAGDSHWLMNGDDTYYSAGNVGIGTDTAGSKLTVNGTIESKTEGVKFPDGSTLASAYPAPIMWSGGCSINGTAAAGVFTTYCTDVTDLDLAAGFLDVDSSGTVEILTAGYYRIRAWSMAICNSMLLLEVHEDGTSLMKRIVFPPNDFWAPISAETVVLLPVGTVLHVQYYCAVATDFLWHLHQENSLYSGLEVTFVGSQ